MKYSEYCSYYIDDKCVFVDFCKFKKEDRCEFPLIQVEKEELEE